METVIRRSEAINQAQIRLLPVVAYDRKSRATKDFEKLTREVRGYVV